jgi:hypothetical protein
MLNFNVIAGNPPYQESKSATSETRGNSSPLYHKFAEVTFRLGEYASLITPSKWLTVESLSSFRNDTFESKHIHILHDYDDFKQVFPQALIAGGVSYWLHNSQEKSETCKWFEHFSNHVIGPIERELNANNFTRSFQDIAIVDKVRQNTEEYITSIASEDKPYNIRSNWDVVGKDCKIKYSLTSFANSVKCRGKLGEGRGARTGWVYVAKDDIPTNSQEYANLDKWQVIENVICGHPDNYQDLVIVEPIILPAGAICTETYRVFTPEGGEYGATCLKKYMMTRFFRYMLFTIKKTNYAAKNTFANIPLQDFTPNSDIDWSKPIAEVDEQLFDKYKLTPEEREYIKSRVKEMK